MSRSPGWLRSMVLAASLAAASLAACVHSDPQPAVAVSSAGAPGAARAPGAATAPPAPAAATADSGATTATAPRGEPEASREPPPPAPPPPSVPPAPAPASAPVDLDGIGYDPVPCRTDHDCWFSRDPGLHPVRRPKNLRRRFRPCVDGEAEPECKQGRCGFGMPIPC